jgi:hypothetical protein
MLYAAKGCMLYAAKGCLQLRHLGQPFIKLWN